MSPIALFIIALIIGIGCIKLTKKKDGKGKWLIRFIGIILCAFSVFGLFTAFL